MQVQVRTLSALAEELGISSVRLIKMDVEGFEQEVVRGARSWLRAHPPTAMIFEIEREACNRRERPFALRTHGRKLCALLAAQAIVVTKTKALRPRKHSNHIKP